MHDTNKCQMQNAYEVEGLKAEGSAGNNNAADVFRSRGMTPTRSAAHMLEETRLTYMESEACWESRRLPRMQLFIFWCTLLTWWLRYHSPAPHHTRHRGL